MLRRSQIPSWYKSSIYIDTGYRAPSTYIKSVASIFQIHNETLNIHTHFWPGILFLYMLFKEPFNKPFEINLCLGAGYIGAITCMFTSAFSHTFKNIDSRISNICSKVDYIGIIVVNLSHQYLDTYILFQNSELFYRFILIESFFATVCIKHTLEGLGSVWALIYPLISCLYSFYTYMYVTPIYKNAAEASLQCSIYVILAGLVFFKGHIPERLCNPGKIFYIVNSHVMHHICIVFAILSALNASKYLH